MELCVPAVLIRRGGQADLSLTHPAALGCLPVTQSSRISAESPPSPTPAAIAQWAPLWSPDSLRPLRLGDPWRGWGPLVSMAGAGRGVCVCLTF